MTTLRVMPFTNGNEKLISLSLGTNSPSEPQTGCFFPEAVFHKLVADLTEYIKEENPAIKNFNLSHDYAGK